MRAQLEFLVVCAVNCCSDNKINVHLIKNPRVFGPLPSDIWCVSPIMCFRGEMDAFFVAGQKDKAHFALVFIAFNKKIMCFFVVSCLLTVLIDYNCF
jgi:hypothetical protein